MHALSLTEGSDEPDLLQKINNYRKRGKGAPIAACFVCANPARTKGLCHKHYDRYRKYGDPRLRALLPSGEQKRFADTLVSAYPLASDDCVIWPFKRRNTGYGTFQHEGKHWDAHRYICWQVHGDPVGNDLEAAHSCGKGQIGCVSPNHLRWATHQENVDDRQRHSSVPGVVISDDMVLQVRTLAGEISQRQIARLLNVSQTHVGDIIRGRRRASVEVTSA